MDIDIKLDRLKQMHHIILNINNEDMCADWELFVGSKPCDADFKYIADNDGYYDECSRLFADLITDAGYWH